MAVEFNSPSLTRTRPKAILTNRNCVACGVVFERIEWMPNKFCSRACYVATPTTKHGGSIGRVKTSEYTAWQNIKRRCFVPSCPNYGNYGGRGISMWPAWVDDFAAFLAYMGPKPTSRHTVERVDNEKGYEPGNLKWSTYKDQLRNRRNNSLLTVGGETRCIAEWSDVTGLNFAQIRKRVLMGWEPQDCIIPESFATKRRKS